VTARLFQRETLIDAIADAPMQRESDLVVSKRLRIVTAFPLQDAERVAQGCLAPFLSQCGRKSERGLRSRDDFAWAAERARALRAMPSSASSSPRASPSCARSARTFSQTPQLLKCLLSARERQRAACTFPLLRLDPPTVRIVSPPPPGTVGLRNVVRDRTAHLPEHAGDCTSPSA